MQLLCGTPTRRKQGETGLVDFQKKADRFSASTETIVPYPTFSEVPFSVVPNRYEYVGPISVRDRGTASNGVVSDSPVLANEGFVTEPVRLAGESAFDIRNPDVASDTGSSSDIWGS